MQYQHTPVLPDELISGIQVKSGGVYLDCTVGGGGHSALILQKCELIKLVAIDHDQMAIAAAQVKLSEFSDRLEFWHGNFSQYRPKQKFDGIIADLGVSSAQLDLPERGFSFRDAGDLDMRMDQSQTLTAADIVNDYAETELSKIFFELGEERYSYRIARAIVKARPLKTTVQLADVIFHAVPRAYRYGRIHPATRVFQALRITVNQELKALETLLQKAPDWLEVGGKIGIISFHSLEDRIVKHRLKEDDRLRVDTKKPVIATEAEVSVNPRSRSAKLRIATKLEPLG